MPRTGPKSKSFMAPRHNPYVRRNGIPKTSIFEDVAGNYLRIARGEAKASNEGDDTEYTGSDEDEHRRRSWTREQKLYAVKYATTARVPDGKGDTKPISRGAASKEIGCTPQMLRTWTRTYDDIVKSSKGSWRVGCSQPAQEPKMEQQLHE